MKEELKSISSIEDYIAMQPIGQQKILKQIYNCVSRIAEDAEACISYRMPAFKKNGILIYFAVFKDHYSLFPGAEPIVYFGSELKNFETSKGAIKIPLDYPVPEQLIEKLVLHNLQKNLRKAELKKKKKQN